MMTTKRLFNKMVSLISAIIMMAVMSANFITANADEELNPDTIISEIAVMINEARAQAGLEKVYVLPYLNEVAEIRAIETAINYDHKRRDNYGFETAIDTEMVSFTMAAEALAVGCATSEEVFEKFAENDAMMMAEMTHIGIAAVYDEDTDYGYYWQLTMVSTDQIFAEQYIPAVNEIVPQAEGDITGDGVVDTFDYLALTGYLDKMNKGIPVHFNEDQLETADCFRDGIVSEADAKVMVRFILGEIDSLPCEF